MKESVKLDIASSAHWSDPSPDDHPVRADNDSGTGQPYILDTERDDDPDPVLVANSKRTIARKRAPIAREFINITREDEPDDLIDSRSNWDSHNAANLSVPDTPLVKKTRPLHLLGLVISFAAILIIGIVVGAYFFGANGSDDSLSGPTSVPEGRAEQSQPASGPSVDVRPPKVAPNPTTTATPGENATQSPGDAQTANIVAQGLIQAGAIDCVNRANTIPAALANSTEAVVIQKPVGDPNKSLLSSMLLPSAASNFKGVSILNFAPNQSNGCSANFQTIDVIGKPCTDALPQIFGASRATPVGTNGFSIVTLTPLARVLAVPAANSCVLVKLEYIP